MEQEERDPVAERVARNDAAFREANERIHDVVEELDLDHERPLPFLCECADLSCTAIVPLTGHEYEAVRRNQVHFVNAPGHVVNARDWARVVADHGRYTVVEKIGEAGEIVAASEREERTA